MNERDAATDTEPEPDDWEQLKAEKEADRLAQLRARSGIVGAEIIDKGWTGRPIDVNDPNERPADDGPVLVPTVEQIATRLYGQADAPTSHPGQPSPTTTGGP